MLLKDVFDCIRTLNVKRVLLAALALGALVLLLRGCVMSRGGQEQALLSEAPELLVFDAEAEALLNMPLEEYIVLCVAGEMPACFEAEALKAQAVAARTYAVCRMSAYGGEPCGRGGGEVCTDSGCCQAYASYGELADNWGEDYTYNLARITDAVSATAGIVATYGGKPIEALYHSCSGGHTEDAVNVFSGAPYLLGVDSPGEEGASSFRAEREYSLREFTRRVNGAYPFAELARRGLDGQVEVLSRYESGRVEKVRLGGVTLTGREFRKLFDLNSANFTLDISSVVTISTLGYGHGVGMSQYGANAMAEEGADYREILAHYYTGIALCPISELGAGG